MTYSKNKKHKKDRFAPKLKSISPLDNLERLPPLKRLALMLEYKRPAHSRFIQYFIDDIIEPMVSGAGYRLEHDVAGNCFVRVGASRVLWSSHTDTVHSEAGFQKIALAGDLLKVAHSEKGSSSCLGADCTTGVWLMLEMITAHVSGLYVFHASEEVGGLGSSHIAKHSPELLEGISFAIAFDRKGKSSIITHQGGFRTCSDAFAHSLAGALPLGFSLDDGGTFTDTANYAEGLLPECSNISVGYEGAHTLNETQSVSHALALREALLSFDEALLVEARDKNEQEELWSRYGAFGSGFRSSYSGGSGWLDYDDLEAFVYANPERVSEFLLEQGFNLDDLLQAPHFLTKGA